MPALLIPVITSALATTALSSTAIAATAFISANAIVLGAALGLQALLTPDNKQKVAAQQYQSRQAMPTLLYGYGTTKLGGTKFEFDTGQGIYLDGLIHSAGPVNRIVNWMLNDQISNGLVDNTAAGGQVSGANTTAPWSTNVNLHTQKGKGNVAPGYLTGNLPSRWTADHRLEGLFITVMACIPATEKTFQKTYPNGPPAVYVIAEMAPVYDPRDPAQVWSDPNTWKYSDNVALAILHYLTAIRGTDSVTGQPVPFGFGFSPNRIDLTSFIAYANVCDQAVPLKAGGTEKRYRIGGTFDMGTEERKTVLNRLLSTGDAEIYQGADGKIAVRGGVWTAPTVTITADHILGYDFEGGADKLATFNRLKVNFSDPKNDYQVIEADPWDDLASQLGSPNGVITQDLSLPMVQSHAQARRLAKIATAKANPTYKLTLTTDLYGLLALGERTIRVVLPELGIDTTFLVTAFTEAADGTCKIGVSSLGPDAYAWTPGAEEGIAPAVADSTKQPTIVPDVVNPVLAVERFSANGSITVLGVKVTVAAPSNPAFKLIGRTRIVGSGTAGWVDMSDVGNLWSLSYRPVSEGQNYEVQVAFQAPFNGTQGPWVPAGTLIVIADADAPAAPTYTSAALRSGAAPTVDHVIKQSPSANARSVQLLRAVGLGKVLADAAIVLTQAEGPSQSDTISDTAALGLNNYWLKALNGSGVASGVASGTKTVINSMQAGNKTVAPYDFANAAWLKTGLTPSAGGNAPDGNAATMLAEIAGAASAHMLRQSVSITSGQRVCVAFGVKGVARTRFRLNIYDAGGTGANACTGTFNVATMTATASGAGAVMTNVVAAITQITADWFILTLTANVASTAADGRFYVLDDAGASSFIGDVAKGALLWGGTIAAVT